MCSVTKLESSTHDHPVKSLFLESFHCTTKMFSCDHEGREGSRHIYVGSKLPHERVVPVDLPLSSRVKHGNFVINHGSIIADCIKPRLYHVHPGKFFDLHCAASGSVRIIKRLIEMSFVSKLIPARKMFVSAKRQTSHSKEKFGVHIFICIINVFPSHIRNEIGAHITNNTIGGLNYDCLSLMIRK